MSEKELTGYKDIHSKPIRVGDIVRYEEDGYEDLYTVKPVGGKFLLISHEDSEYNVWLGDIPVEIVHTPAGEGEEK